jgi:hypothetical protein
VKKLHVVTVAVLAACSVGLLNCKSKNIEGIYKVDEEVEEKSHEDTLGVEQEEHVSLPRNFPKLPSNYLEWKRYHVEGSLPEASTNLPDSPVTSLSDTPWEIDPPALKLNHLEGSLRKGWARYVAHPVGEGYSEGYVNKIDGVIEIRWFPHIKDELDAEKIRDYLIDTQSSLVENMLALGERGLEKISIAGYSAYRLRGWWWYSCCDDSYHDVGAVTSFFIPAEKLDVTIVCVNLIYNYEESPEGATPEEMETWKPEKFYSNNIAELERAVEQSFRVKEK